MVKKNANEINNINDLAVWISEGRQIGFSYGEQSYCIGYGTYADGQGTITLTEQGSGTILGSYIDLDEFLNYARIQDNLLSPLWPMVTDIMFFVPKEVAQ